MKKTLYVLALTLASLSTNAQTLIAHWPFTGGNYDDVVNPWPNVSPGTNLPTPAAGKLGVPNTAMQFDGIDDYLEFRHEPTMDQRSWTITAVIQPTGYWPGLCQGNSILWRGAQYSSEHYSMIFFDNWADNNNCAVPSNGRYVFAASAYGLSTMPVANWGGAGTTPVVTNPIINLNQWYCVTAIYNDVTDIMDLYVDGVHVVSQIWGAPGLYNFTNLNPMFIGKSDDAVTGIFAYLLNGVLDDVRFYQGSFAWPTELAAWCDIWAEEGTTPFKNGTTGVKQVATDKISVAPNPTTGEVTITTPAGWEDGSIMIINSVGAVVKFSDVQRNGTTTIDISNIPAGIYLVDAQFNGHNLKTKLVKQ